MNLIIFSVIVVICLSLVLYLINLGIKNNTAKSNLDMLLNFVKCKDNNKFIKCLESALKNDKKIYDAISNNSVCSIIKNQDLLKSILSDKDGLQKAMRDAISCITNNNCTIITAIGY